MRPLSLAALLSLVLAAPAWAGDNGEGLLGENTDKLVTFLSLGVLGFFVLVVTLGSVAQHLLDKRKDEMKAHRMRQRSGW